MTTLIIYVLVLYFVLPITGLVRVIIKDKKVVAPPQALIAMIFFWPALLVKNSTYQMILIFVLAALMLIGGISVARASDIEVVQTEQGIEWLAVLIGWVAFTAVAWWFTGKIDESENDHADLL